MAQVVGRAEHEVESDVLLFLHMVDRGHIHAVNLLLGRNIPQSLILALQQYRVFGDYLIANLTFRYGHIRIPLKELLLGIAQQAPVPVTDGVVLLISDIVDDQFLACCQFHVVCLVLPVGIEVRLNVEQRHRAVRGGGDGERYVHRLAVGVGRAGIGRDELVVDVDRTLDIPVVGGYGIVALILAADVIAVVDDGLRAVHEVARCLPVVHRSGKILELLVADSVRIQAGHRNLMPIGLLTLAVHILCIDETATDTRLHVDKVEFDNTGDVAPVFLP